jgi:hypothetical protein
MALTFSLNTPIPLEKERCWLQSKTIVLPYKQQPIPGKCHIEFKRFFMTDVEHMKLTTMDKRLKESLIAITELHLVATLYFASVDLKDVLMTSLTIGNAGQSRSRQIEVMVACKHDAAADLALES